MGKTASERFTSRERIVIATDSPSERALQTDVHRVRRRSIHARRLTLNAQVKLRDRIDWRKNEMQVVWRMPSCLLNMDAIN